MSKEKEIILVMAVASDGVLEVALPEYIQEVITEEEKEYLSEVVDDITEMYARILLRHMGGTFVN